MAASWFLARRGGASAISAAARWATSSYRSAASSSFSARLLPFSSFSSPFDSMDFDRKRRTMTLRRKTEDEIIEILVKEESYKGHACMRVKINYGFDFKKCMKFDIKARPDNSGQIVIPKVEISVEGEGEDEFEGFLKGRELNRCVEGGSPRG